MQVDQTMLHPVDAHYLMPAKFTKD